MEVGTTAIDSNVSVVPAYCVQIQCCGFESCLDSSYINFLDTNFGAFFSFIACKLCRTETFSRKVSPYGEPTGQAAEEEISHPTP